MAAPAFPHVIADRPDIQGNFDALVKTPWHNVGDPGEPAFQNSWVNYGSTVSPVSFYKDGLGVVHLRGGAKNGSSASAVVFTLPAGYRPAYLMFFPVFLDTPAINYCRVTAAGNVSFPSGDTVGSFLDGITFRGEL